MTTEITKEFAPDYPQDEHGWFLFPRDVEYRKSLYPQGVFNHPAKANCFLIQELYRYLTEPGDSIIDPFGGTGTLLLAAREGRKVVLIDVEEPFVNLQKETLENWQRDGVELADTYIYHGDNRQVLEKMQFLCDAAIFSPPYSSAALGAKVGFKEWREEGTLSEQYVKVGEYGGQEASALNMGRLNPINFSVAMDLLYRRLSARLVVGAKVAVITKDVMKGPTRVFISEPTIQMCKRNQLKLINWQKWKAPGSMMKQVLRSKGASVVDEEDILFFTKVSYKLD